MLLINVAVMIAQQVVYFRFVDDIMFSCNRSYAHWLMVIYTRQWDVTMQTMQSCWCRGEVCYLQLHLVLISVKWQKVSRLGLLYVRCIVYFSLDEVEFMCETKEYYMVRVLRAQITGGIGHAVSLHAASSHRQR